MFLRKGSNGSLYVARVTGSGNRGSKIRSQSFRDWFLVKWSGSGSGGVLLKADIYTPMDLVGKKVRLKVEVLTDDCSMTEEEFYKDKYRRLLAYVTAVECHQCGKKVEKPKFSYVSGQPSIFNWCSAECEKKHNGGHDEKEANQEGT
jgi:hypothetical protein